MSLWLRAFKLDPPYLSGNRYGLSVENRDPKDHGLSKTPISDHTFPTIQAVTDFIVNNCKPLEYQISEIEQSLSQQGKYWTKISEESARKMGFKNWAYAIVGCNANNVPRYLHFADTYDEAANLIESLKSLGWKNIAIFDAALREVKERPADSTTSD